MTLRWRPLSLGGRIVALSVFYAFDGWAVPILVVQAALFAFLALGIFFEWRDLVHCRNWTAEYAVNETEATSAQD